MTPRRSGRSRLLLASGALLAAGGLLTAAAFTDHADVDVAMDGSSNRFDLVVAGSAVAGWLPTSSAWEQGNPDAYQIKLTPDGSGYVISPGGELDVRLAAKNASPRLAAGMTLTIRDPDPHGDAVDPATGRHVDLWSQLVFTVRSGNTVLLDHVKSADLTPYVWHNPLPAGEHRLLDVQVQVPESTDNTWQLAATGVQFNFEAINS